PPPNPPRRRRNRGRPHGSATAAAVSRPRFAGGFRRRGWGRETTVAGPSVALAGRGTAAGRGALGVGKASAAVPGGPPEEPPYDGDHGRAGSGFARALAAVPRARELRGARRRRLVHRAAAERAR